MTTQQNLSPVVTATPESVAPPSWFQKRRERAAAAAQKKLERTKAAPLVVPAEEQEFSWDEKLRRWLIGADAVGLVVSFMLHLALMVLLSFVFVQGMTGKDGFSTLISQSDGTELNTIIELPGEQAGGQSELELPQMQPLPEMEPSEDAIAVPSDLLASDEPASGQGQGQGTGSGDGSGEGAGKLAFRMPAAGEAVTKGSFTAWTVPEDPAPGENYLIVIQIRLPDNIEVYPVRDLSGLVEGTDRYRQPIGGRFASNRKLPVVAGNVQISVMVPGAARLVRDKIQVRSRLLREEQTLEIVF